MERLYLNNRGGSTQLIQLQLKQTLVGQVINNGYYCVTQIIIEK